MNHISEYERAEYLRELMAATVTHKPRVRKLRAQTVPSNGGLMNRDWRYTPAVATNIRTTFARVQAQIAQQKGQ